MSVYRFTTRVAYPDLNHEYRLSMTGAMRMMQEAACVHSDSLGFSFRTVDKTRVHWLFVGWQVEMTGTARWNDTLHVDTWPRTMERVTSKRDFEIFNDQGELICRATSNWILVSSDTNRATRITPEIVAAYPLTERCAFETDPLLPPVNEGHQTFDFFVQRRDLDTNNHVNNLIYLDYARQALPEGIWNKPFPFLTVRYNRELLVGDHVCCIYFRGEGIHTVELRNDEDLLHATITFME